MMSRPVRIRRDDTGEVFPSASEAGRHVGASAADICRSARTGMRVFGSTYSYAEARPSTDTLSTQRIWCVETGEHFSSASEAARMLGATRSQISRCARDMTRTVHGFTSRALHQRRSSRDLPPARKAASHARPYAMPTRHPGPSAAPAPRHFADGPMAGYTSTTPAHAGTGRELAQRGTDARSCARATGTSTPPSPLRHRLLASPAEASRAHATRAGWPAASSFAGPEERDISSVIHAFTSRTRRARKPHSKYHRKRNSSSPPRPRE